MGRSSRKGARVWEVRIIKDKVIEEKIKHICAIKPTQWAIGLIRGREGATFEIEEIPLQEYTQAKTPSS